MKKGELRKFHELIFDLQTSKRHALRYGLCKSAVQDLEQIERAIKSIIPTNTQMQTTTTVKYVEK